MGALLESELGLTALSLPIAPGNRTASYVSRAFTTL